MKLERFLQRGETSVDQMIHRVSYAIAANEADQVALASDMRSGSFLPAGRTLKFAGAGGIPPNCAVLPMNLDCHGTLAQDLSRMMRLSAQTTGIGISLGNIPPRSAVVDNRKELNSPGPVHALIGLSAMMNTVSHVHREHGHMAVLPVSHPEVKEFASLKEDHSRVTNFNLSVSVDSQFMDNVLHNTNGHEFNLLHFLAQCAHANSEPGLIFIDQVQTAKWCDSMPDITAAVPCGEQFMHEYETCNLGAINLYNFADRKNFHWNALERTIRLGVRTLYNVTSLLYIPDNDVMRMTRRVARIGLGVMGWASALRRMRIPYASPASLDMAKKISSTIKKHSHDEITTICRQINVNLPPTITCVAPTGGISLLASYILQTDISPGLEPYFDEATSVAPRDHIDMQSVWQMNLDNAISKTINLSSSATVEDVLDCFVYAYRKGCKGITVHRNGTRNNNPLSIECAKC